MIRFVFILFFVITFCLTGCSNTLPTHTSNPSTAATLPRGTTTPQETTESIALSIAWSDPDNSQLYSYEDYFAFERVFNGTYEELSEYIRAGGTIFTPYVTEGKLYLADTQNSIRFQVGCETYTDLRIFGTDGSLWIYCADAGRELFRIDPLGNKETLFIDETRRIGSGGLDSGAFRLEDQFNLAYFTAGSENGYGIYRLHIPSMRIDLIAEEDAPISLWSAKSNYQISYFTGSYLGGGETILSTPAKEWDLSDPNIPIFQALLSPDERSLLNGRSNWYNAATFLLFERPEAVSLSGLMRNGFRDLSSKLTSQELAALGNDAASETDYCKLPGYRINEVLQALLGLDITDLESNTLSESSGTLYHAQSDTYYKPYSMGYDENGQLSIYIWEQEIEVHKVEEKEDGIFWVYYLPHTPAPFGTSEDWEEHMMVLKKAGSSYRILSNSTAVSPLDQ